MSNVTKLEEMLNNYKVGELKELAKISGVTGYSKLKKAELIEVVGKQLTSVDISGFDIPEEIKKAAVPSTTDKKETSNDSSSPKNTGKKEEKKKVASSRKIIGVAPHVMNVMSENQPPIFPASALSEKKSSKKIYPNDPCPCGSGKKYKKCCGRK